MEVYVAHSHRDDTEEMMLLLVNYTLHSAAVLCMVALSLRLCYGFDRFYNFSLAGCFTLSSFVLQSALGTWGTSLFVGLSLSVAAAGGLGLGLEILVFGSLRNRGARPDVSMLVSIALSAIVVNIVAILWGDETRYFSSALSWKSTANWFALSSPLTLSMLGCWAGSLLLVGVWSEFSRSGTALRAMTSSLDLALPLGINISATARTVSVAAGIIAGIAGILAGADTSISPNMGFDAAMGGIVVAILARRLSVLRLAIAATFVGALYTAVGYFFRAEWANAGAFVLLLVVLGLRSCGKSARAGVLAE